MRILAVTLSLLLPLAAAAQAPASSTQAIEISSASLVEFSTIKVTAPRLQENAPAQEGALKAVRAGGVGMAAGGLGIFAYAVIFEAAGPIGWAAGLLFFGGMTAYISHRHLHGHDDFSPDEARKDGAKTGRP
jgi:cobalamin synthase